MPAACGLRRDKVAGHRLKAAAIGAVEAGGQRSNAGVLIGRPAWAALDGKRADGATTACKDDAEPLSIHIAARPWSINDWLWGGPPPGWPVSSSPPALPCIGSPGWCTSGTRRPCSMR